MKLFIISLFVISSFSSFADTYEQEEGPIINSDLCMELADWYDHPLDQLDLCEETKEYHLLSNSVSEDGLEFSKILFRAQLDEEEKTIEVFFHINDEGIVVYMYEL
ncbi:hypothetical protein A9Q84_13580 [Halobacteriovorax marinus]|uniref:Secreted protein n=1 Tax=Halobacteriovorax marinus TaxID=97084 RepID=A0A1Y5FEN9_9BACT|nr:hypothetical protein A9Q84_13580 [Halobacteriovorax marinus]